MTFFQQFAAATAIAGAVPDTPQNFVATAASLGAAMSWDANKVEDNILYYKVYRANGLNQLFASATMIFEVNDISTNDLTTLASTDYTYFLVATNVYGDSLPTSGQNVTTGSTSVTPTSSGITTTEALSAGNVCNIYASSGAKVRKANATDTSKPANCFVLAAFGSGVAATVYFAGQIITGLVGLTAGATYWLDTTGGAITVTPPSGAGNGVQEIGIALSTTTLLFNPKVMVGL